MFRNNLLRILFIVLIGLLIFSLSTKKVSPYYFESFHEITLGDELLRCYYEESRSFFMIGNKIEGYNDINMDFNEVKLDSKMNLSVARFEAYYQNGVQDKLLSSWVRESGTIYKEVNTNITRLKIKRKNNTIYDGKFISDISKYVNEEGRYYFHLYIRNQDGLMVTKDHITFNVLVVRS